MADIWKDPSVKGALKQGRAPSDIMVLACNKCGEWGYYNEGSSFYCYHCKTGYRVLSEDEESGDTEPIVYANEAISLDDTVTVTTDGYDNETLPMPNTRGSNSPSCAGNPTRTACGGS